MAPAFDLTFSEGPMGQHHMDVCGEGAAVQHRHLMQLADEGGVAGATAAATIERMLEQASGFLLRASAFQIRRETVHDMAKVIAKCRRLMAS